MNQTNYLSLKKINNMKTVLFILGVIVGCLAIEGYWLATMFFIFLILIGVIYEGLKSVDHDNFNESW
jgi:hypothetical protein